MLVMTKQRSNPFYPQHLSSGNINGTLSFICSNINHVKLFSLSFRFHNTVSLISSFRHKYIFFSKKGAKRPQVVFLCVCCFVWMLSNQLFAVPTERLFANKYKSHDNPLKVERDGENTHKHTTNVENMSFLACITRCDECFSFYRG